MEKTHPYYLSKDGNFPNNSHLPLLHYQKAFDLKKNPEETIKKIFLENNWYRPWVNGIYDFHHYHSNNHEVLGIAEGNCSVLLGGDNGILLLLNKGDAVIIPAGVSHKRVECSGDFSCVGAYSIDEAYNMKHAKTNELAAALNKIKSLSLPDKDPIFGNKGPLFKYWKK